MRVTRDDDVVLGTLLWRPSTTRYERYVKPVLDRVVALLGLLIALPMLLLIALLILIRLGRPMILCQVRVGRGGEKFTLYKFRTMLPDRRKVDEPYDGEERRLTHKHPHDPRLTPLGRKLRKWSFDELPQLWNVVKGDMSLVGPRPELVDIVARYHPWQHRRHAVKPGLTGLWQVKARGNGPMQERTDLDVSYTQRVTLRDDLRILVLTVPALLGAHLGS
jgi:lipopolysaccharide/colanic/teichoic acid biosynthesis glycosyltransferase